MVDSTGLSQENRESISACTGLQRHELRCLLRPYAEKRAISSLAKELHIASSSSEHFFFGLWRWKVGRFRQSGTNSRLGNGQSCLLCLLHAEPPGLSIFLKPNVHGHIERMKNPSTLWPACYRHSKPTFARNRVVLAWSSDTTAKS
jgi:hypothetical protein